MHYAPYSPLWILLPFLLHFALFCLTYTHEQNSLKQCPQAGCFIYKVFQGPKLSQGSSSNDSILGGEDTGGLDASLLPSFFLPPPSFSLP